MMTLRRVLTVAWVVLATLAPTTIAAQQDLQSITPRMASSAGVFLRGLDKVSGVTTDLAITVGEPVSYGRMAIALLDCRFPADDPAAEAYAFLEIRDEADGEWLFRGWMVATAPALNALDHPRYDVWVMGCQ